METSDSSTVFSTVLSAEEWSQIPSDLGEKLITFVKSKFDEYITSKALYETKKVEIEEKFAIVKNELNTYKSKNEDCDCQLEIAKKTITELENQLTLSTNEVTKFQETSNRLESSTAEFRHQRDMAIDERDSLTQIERLQTDLKALSAQLNTAVNAKCEALAKIEEVSSLKLSLEYKERHMEQEKSFLHNQIKNLTSELNKRAGELQNSRHEHTTNSILLETKLSSKSEELRIATETIATLTSNNKTLTCQAEELNEKLKKQHDSEIKLQELFNNVLLAQTRLVELYKSQNEENNSQVEELQKGIVELQNLVRSASDQYGELETKHRDSEIEHEEILNKKNECIVMLKKELDTANELLKQAKEDNLHREIENLSPSAATASRLIKGNTSLTQIYLPLVTTSENLAAEKDENRRLNSYINKIVQEFEDRTPILQKEREDYEHALETISELTKHNENMILECHRLREECSEAKKLENRAFRDNERMKKEITDLARQQEYERTCDQHKLKVRQEKQEVTEIVQKEENSIEEKSKEQLPVEDKPKKQLPIKDKPKEQLPITEKSKEELPIKEKLLIKVKSKEKSPDKQKLKEELSVKDNSKKILPITEKSKEESPIKEKSKEELPIKNKSKKSLPITEKLKDESPSKEKLSKEKPPIKAISTDISQNDFLKLLNLTSKSNEIKKKNDLHISIRMLIKKNPKIRFPSVINKLNIDPKVDLSKNNKYDEWILSNANLGIWSVNSKSLKGDKIGIVFTRIKENNKNDPSTSSTGESSNTNVDIEDKKKVVNTSNKKKKKNIWTYAKRRKGIQKSAVSSHQACKSSNSEKLNVTNSPTKRKNTEEIDNEIATKVRKLSENNKTDLVKNQHDFEEENVPFIIATTKNSENAQMQDVESLPPPLKKSFVDNQPILKVVVEKDDKLISKITNKEIIEALPPILEEASDLLIFGTEVEIFLCQTCNKVFDSAIALKQHKRSVHKLSLRCNKCSKKFCVVESLVKHNLKDHPEKVHNQESQGSSSQSESSYEDKLEEETKKVIIKESCTDKKTRGALNQKKLEDFYISLDNEEENDVEKEDDDPKTLSLIDAGVTAQVTTTRIDNDDSFDKLLFTALRPEKPIDVREQPIPKTTNTITQTKIEPVKSQAD